MAASSAYNPHTPPWQDRAGGPAMTSTPGSDWAVHTAADLIVLTDLIATGTWTPIATRGYPLSQPTAAVRDLDEDHSRGKVVITV